MLLVVCLAIIALLALLGASFSFQMNADLASVNAVNHMQQAWQAAWSGVDRAELLLREKRTNVEAWWDNREVFRRILVWAPNREGGTENLADQEAVEGQPAWRFSIVAPQFAGDETKLRYGITDEAGKINLNTASRAQLLALFDQLELEAENTTPQQLADCLIDWLDEDNTPTSLNGAESGYYMTLNPPYRAKNRPLQTVEELLMVKHFNGRILYGEDYNRNGHLDENEDDGEEGVFPPDNGDGVLDRGILPFVTVYSWDWNWGNDNKRRLPISVVTKGIVEQIPAYMTEEIRPEVLEFIVEANARGYKFRSVGELLGLEVYENGVSNYTQAWEEYDDLAQAAEKDRLELVESEEEKKTEEGKEEKEKEKGAENDGEEEGAKDGDLEKNLGPGDDGAETDREPEEESRSGLKGSDNRKDKGKEGEESLRPGKDTKSRRQQSIRDSREAPAEEKEADDGKPSGDERRTGPRRPGIRGRDRGAETRGKDEGQPGEQPEDAEGVKPEDSGEGEGGEAEKGEEGKKKSPEPKGTPIVSPVTAADMVVLMDRLTAQDGQAVPGLINVNTAPPQVLKTIPGLSEKDVESIVGSREQLSGEDKMTTAWLVTSGVLDARTFSLVCNQLTTRSIQFTIDSIGFADHAGAFRRIQVVVEMRGHLAQVKYYRDITSLGMGYPVRNDQGSDEFELSSR